MAIVCLMKLYRAGINIVGVVPPDMGNATYEYFVQFAKSMNYRVIDYERSLKEPVFLNKIKALEADIAVVCSYNKLFPQEFLKLTKDGFINVHPSLLPEYRGANPYSHVIINGETETGVSFHFMDEHFDTGDVIAQFKVPVEKDETMGTIFNKLNNVSADGLAQLLAYYETNPLPRIKQPEGDFKKAYSIDINLGNCMIDWTKPAVEIERFIRALNPFIMASTRYKGHFIKIYTAFVQNKTPKEDPGTICYLKDTIGVACADGIVHIKTLQGGTYISGDAKDFIKIFNPKTGEKFET